MPKRTNEQVLIEEFLDDEFSQQNQYTSRETLFEYLVPSKLLAPYDLGDDEIERGVVGGSNDGGCDSVYLFCNETLVSEDTDLKDLLKRRSRLQVAIIQCKTSKSFGRDTFLKWKETCRDLLSFDTGGLDFEAKYSKEVLAVFDTIRSAIALGARKGSSVSFVFYDVAIANQVHDDIEREARELEKLVCEVIGVSDAQASVKFIGAKSLVDAWNPPEEYECIIRFTDAFVNIRGRSDYIGLVSLSDYYKFLTNESGSLKTYLFEANVRDYQGNVEVNKAIDSTLAHDTGEDFWWLNNGVTILASQTMQAAGGEVRMTDPRVVNGLQTSYAIFNYMSSLSGPKEDERNLLVRVIVPETDETSNKIIMATNSQTQIAKTSLRGTDPIHLHIEMHMKQRGLYYDRRRNYYKNQGKKPEEIISISFLGQCLMTLLLAQPNQARARPSTILADEASYRRMFKDNGNLEIYYKAAKVGRTVFSIFERERESYTRSQMSDLRFYVLLAVMAKLTGEIPITENTLTNFDHEKITKEDVEWAAKRVLTKYEQLGSDAKAAKSSEMADAVIADLSEYLGIEQNANGES